MAGADARPRTLRVSRDEDGGRLDLFLAAHLPDLSRAQIQRLIRGGHVRVPRARSKPSLAVEDGWTIEVTSPPAVPATPQPEALPLVVLHEDADLVVIDKPAGMVVHPAAGHASGTLVNALLHRVSGLSGIGGVARPGIVHRLDRGTSGVMVVAKNDAAHRALSRQFHDRQVTKEYVALVWGDVRAGTTFDRPIGRDPKHRTKISSRAARPRAAVTTIVAAERRRGVTEVRVRIGTGRTHQIRVHLSEAGHPIVGDALYGGVRRSLPADLTALGALDRPYLHAASLTFAHPRTGETMTFEAPLPADLRTVRAALGRHTT